MDVSRKRNYGNDSFQMLPPVACAVSYERKVMDWFPCAIRTSSLPLPPNARLCLKFAPGKAWRCHDAREALDRIVQAIQSSSCDAISISVHCLIHRGVNVRFWFVMGSKPWTFTRLVVLLPMGPTPLGIE